jgi:choline kinase
MAKIQAVILAGGVGSRLGAATKDRPKCLVEVGGIPLIKHQLEALADHGVGPVLIVLGYKAEAVREVVGEAADYVVNTRYEETNSLYSLWLARNWVKGPFLLLNCDLLFHPDILDRVLENGGSVLAYDSTSLGGREQTKVAIRDGRVLDLGKDIPAGASRGENLGLLKFDAEGARALFESVEILIEQGHEKTWVTEAVRTTCSKVPIRGVNVAGLPWAEIDFPYDLDRARREVWPAIVRSRSRPARLWRRFRWAAAALVALGLATGGWLSSMSVGPASIDWETVAPITGAKVRVMRPKGSQRWWLAGPGDSVAVVLDGVDRARVELRLLLAPGSPKPGKYVVQLSVDGEPYDWKVLKATPDSLARVPGYLVGDRDRMEIRLPPGTHNLVVKLLAGTGEALLTRVRRPE